MAGIEFERRSSTRTPVSERPAELLADVKLMRDGPLSIFLQPGRRE